MNSGYASWAARWRVPLGFALGIVYLVVSRPTVKLLAAGAGVALLGLIVRAVSAGHLVKNQLLTTSGPYAHTRNPLYLGSSLLGAGFVIAGGSWPLAVAFTVFIALVYWPVIRREEEGLRRQFGESFDQYAAAVPAFFPRLARWPGARLETFRWHQYRKNREYEAALGYLAGIIFLALKFKLR